MVDWFNTINIPSILAGKTPKGWDPKHLTGCWMDDYKSGQPIDYCEDKQAFDTLKEAMEYAVTLEWWAVVFDTKWNWWVVEEMDGTR